MTRIRNAGDLDRFCGFAEKFPTDETGRPLPIESFQRQVLADYFARARETIVLLSRKNGKTSLFSGQAPHRHVALCESPLELSGDRALGSQTERMFECDRARSNLTPPSSWGDWEEG